MKHDQRTVSLAYSTCPNDTFIFNAIYNRLIDLAGINFKIELHDVEALNQNAAREVFEVSKLSFAAIAHLKGRYRMLRSGAALGKGCGPLIVAKKGALSSGKLENETIAVPGLWTTACMLASLYLKGRINPVPMRFDEIMPAVKAGKYACGVIIHEGRFTYQDYGLTSLVDLGQWWEDTTGLPIPLGVIGVKSGLPKELCLKTQNIIRQSVVYARRNPHDSYKYVREHASEMAIDVIDRHIDLYVNDFTEEIGENGQHAIEKLFEKAASAGMIRQIPQPLFAT